MASLRKMSTSPHVCFGSCSATVSKSSSAAEENWLDLLPLEVTYQLIACFPCHSSNNPIIPLAKVSPRLRTAINTVLNDCYVSHGPWDRNRWQTALRRLDIDSADPNAHTCETVDEYAEFLQHFRDCEWDTARMYCGNHIVVTRSAEKSSKSLAFLATRAKDGLKVFVDVVFGSGITQLTITCECSSRSERACFLERAMEFSMAQGIPLESTVRKIQLKCRTSRRDGHTLILSTFKCLQEVELLGWPTMDEDMVTRLRSLDSLHVVDTLTTDIRNVLEVTQSLTHIDFRIDSRQGNLLQADDLLILARCPKLKSLTGNVAPGAEATVMFLPKTLETLDLDWRPSFLYFDLHRQGQKYAVRERAIFNFVSRCPSLSVLQLRDATMSRTEIADILRTMGGRLLELRISISFDHTALESLAFIVEQMTISNPNLRSVEMPLPAKARFNFAHYEGNLQTFANPQRRRLLIAFNVLRRRALRLDTSSLEKAICSVFERDQTNGEF